MGFLTYRTLLLDSIKKRKQLLRFDWSLMILGCQLVTPGQLQTAKHKDACFLASMRCGAAKHMFNTSGLTLETQAHAGTHQTGRVGNINKQLAAIVIQGVSKETHWQRLSFVGIWRCETCPWLSLAASEEISLQVFIYTPCMKMIFPLFLLVYSM